MRSAPTSAFRQFAPFTSPLLLTVLLGGKNYVLLLTK